MLVGTLPDRASTTYTSLLYEAVESAGATVDDLTVRKLFQGRYDVIHLHWPEWYLYRRPVLRMFVRSSIVLTALAWTRWRGARLVWTAHNLVPHEPTPARSTRLFYWLFTGLVDAVISPSVAAVEPLRQRYPRVAGTPVTVVPLGHLRGHYADHRSRATARARLGIADDAVVATFFGHVRPYKGVCALVHAFREVSAPGAILLVCGRALDDGVRQDVENAARGDDRVRLRLAFIADDEVQHLLRAADLVVVPYAESSNSLVALLALSFDRPILAPAFGPFPELAEAVGRQWVQLYEGELSASTLTAALTAARERDGDGERPVLDDFDWDAIGDATLDVYRRTIGTNRTASDLHAAGARR